MKQVGIILWMLVLLTGCSGEHSELERGMQLRTKLLQASGCSFETDVTADYGDKLHNFSMTCQADAKGAMTFTITAPESISGITGTMSGEGGELVFDDTALHFDLLAEDQVSPVSAPWIFLNTLRSGYITAAGMEGEELRLSIDDSYDEDALRLDIWLDGEELPKRGEILYDGRRIVSLDVKNFRLS